MEVFEGPQLTPPTVSLLSAAEIVPMTGDRWTSGFDLINEGSETGYADLNPGGGGVFEICPEVGTFKVIGASGANESYTPYVIYATDKCSTWPAKREFYDRAQRKLLAAESTALELQLWDGVSNPFLADGAGAQNVIGTVTVPMTATSAKEAMALLEQEMGEISATRGMIHIRPQVLFLFLRRRLFAESATSISAQWTTSLCLVGDTLVTALPVRLLALLSGCTGTPASCRFAVAL